MNKKYIDTAHELWSAAQLVPGDGIEDGVRRIANILIAIDAERIAELEQMLGGYKHDQAALIGEQVKDLLRIKELESEMLEQCRIIGMSCEREEALRTALAESRANDRHGMAYLAQVRAVVGGADVPDMVKRVEKQAEALAKAREALSLISKYAPTTLECNCFHHPKHMRHDAGHPCEPTDRYYNALSVTSEAIAAIDALIKQ